MIGLTNAGGGIDNLRLRVFGGGSRPTNPRENDIWIETSGSLRKIRYVLTPNGYTGEAYDNTWGGDAVIYYGTTVDKNSMMILRADPKKQVYDKPGYTYSKENRIWIMPTKCVFDPNFSKPLNAYYYKNGSWHQFSTAVPEWDGTLFYNGNQYTKYTGGWTAVGGGAKVGTNLTLDTSGFAGIRSTSKVDVTKFNRLRFKCASKFSVLGDDHSGFGLKSDGIGWNNCDDNYAAALWNLSGKTEGSLDISKISGSYYVTFFVYAREGYAAGVDVNKIWLE